MRSSKRNSLCLLGVLAALSSRAPCTAAEFPLRDGDLWVMAGDSITAQHLHSNYFEAFCFARYPRLHFAFRNAGVGGHTIPTTLARFDYDIAAWRPTVVSVELGMNDKGNTPTPKFIANMATMVERIRGIHARPVVFSSSPVNDGSTHARLLGGNQRLYEYSVALRQFAAREKVPYADQFDALLDVWGKNKPREAQANPIRSVQEPPQEEMLATVPDLRAYLATQAANPSKPIPNKPVSMQGDPVHPGPPGQLMMAAALLKALGANGFVSSVRLDATGKVLEERGCKVDAVKADNGKIAFDRLDDCGPFPIPDDARAVLGLDPTILELSRYTLQVTGLKDPMYDIRINGVHVARPTSGQLASGINLTALGAGWQAKEVNPIVTRARAILAAVAAKEALVGQWRTLSKKAHAPGAPADIKAQLAALGTRVEEADARIREAAKPRKLHFELSSATRR
jgi:lysophospholipase L1-like esterase